MHRISALAVLTLVACSAPLTAEEASVHALPVVYGQDDRRELYEVNDPSMDRAARSVAAIIPRDNITTLADGTVRWSPVTAGESYNLCPDERFADQPALATCTAALIDDDLVVTAGHCFAHALDCENFVFAFDYAYRAPGELAWGDTPELFECERAIVQQTVISLDEPDALDFAVVQLTKPVPGRTPLALRATPPENGEPITVISATLGVPLKMDRGGQVLDPRSDRSDFFIVDSDTFHGSSGAPVLDAEGALMGVFVRGHEDFGYDASHACSVVSTRPSIAGLAAEGEDAGPAVRDAEEATHIARAIDALCATGYPSARLCGTADRGNERDAGPIVDRDAGPQQPDLFDGDSHEAFAPEPSCTVRAQPRARRPITASIGFGSLLMLAWLRRRSGLERWRLMKGYLRLIVLVDAVLRVDRDRGDDPDHHGDQGAAH